MELNPANSLDKILKVTEQEKKSANFRKEIKEDFALQLKFPSFDAKDTIKTTNQVSVSRVIDDFDPQDRIMDEDSARKSIDLFSKDLDSERGLQKMLLAQGNAATDSYMTLVQ